MHSAGAQSWYFMTVSIPSPLFLACTQQFGATCMREKYKTQEICWHPSAESLQGDRLAHEKLLPKAASTTAADSEERQLQPGKLRGFCAGYNRGLRGSGSDPTHLSGTRPERDTPRTARSPAGLARGSSSGCRPPGAGGWPAAPRRPTERRVRAEASEPRPLLSSPLPPRSPAWCPHLLRVHGGGSDSEEWQCGRTPRQPGSTTPAAAPPGPTLSLFLPQRSPAPPRCLEDGAPSRAGPARASPRRGTAE